MYMIASSVASFLEWGGGGKTLNVPRKKIMYINLHARASEARRAPQKHIIFRSHNTSVYICNQCSSLLLLLVLRYKRQYINKTLTLRTIYEYASQRSERA